jgi:hypothetical protein
MRRQGLGWVKALAPNDRRRTAEQPT